MTMSSTDTSTHTLWYFCRTIGNCMWPIEWHYYQWPWVTLKITFPVCNLSNSHTLWNIAQTYYTVCLHEFKTTLLQGTTTRRDAKLSWPMLCESGPAGNCIVITFLLLMRYVNLWPWPLILIVSNFKVLNSNISVVVAIWEGEMIKSHQKQYILMGKF